MQCCVVTKPGVLVVEDDLGGIDKMSEKGVWYTCFYVLERGIHKKDTCAKVSQTPEV